MIALNVLQYRAFCVKCQGQITGEKGYVMDMNIPTYIGESSRPARERISEHLRYVHNWNRESVILYHWMECHGTEVQCPQFKFELIGTYNDPLRRQLTEAIQISKQATLNSKYEFGVNEIFSLQCASSAKEKENQYKKELHQRQCDRIKLENFIEVMSKVQHTNSILSRSNKRTAKQHENNSKRLRTMETSTPKNMGQFRDNKIIPDESTPTSPITTSSSALVEEGDSEEGCPQRIHTNLSDKLELNKLTPTKLVSESAEDRRLFGGARDLSRAKMKSTSLPNLSWDNVENCLFFQYPTRNKLHILRPRTTSLGSSGDVDITEWSNKDFSSNNNIEREQESEQTGQRVKHETMPGNRAEQGLMTSGGRMNVIENTQASTHTPSRLQLRNEILDGSPILRSAKRPLRLSPSTPVGLARKHQLCRQGQNISTITMDEDIEMFDLEAQDLEKDETRELSDSMVYNKAEIPRGRTLIKGLRRRNTSLVNESESAVNKAGTSACAQGPEHNLKEANAQGIKSVIGSTQGKFKGKSIKQMKQLCRKSPRNYKSTRKKREKKNAPVDKKQSLINQYFSTDPNKIFVGLNSDDISGP